MAFDSRREKHSGIYIVNIANGSVRGVTTFTDADSVVPSWSQDEQWIYFASDHARNVFHISKVAVNGGLPGW